MCSTPQCSPHWVRCSLWRSTFDLASSVSFHWTKRKLKKTRRRKTISKIFSFICLIFSFLPLSKFLVVSDFPLSALFPKLIVVLTELQVLSDDKNLKDWDTEATFFPFRNIIIIINTFEITSPIWHFLLYFKLQKSIEFIWWKCNYIYQNLWLFNRWKNIY